MKNALFGMTARSAVVRAVKFDPAPQRNVLVKMTVARAGAVLFFLFATSVQAQGRWMVNHGSQVYVPSIAAHLTPVGRLEATNRLRLAIGLPLHNQPKLDATLQALMDPAGPRYHQWLTPEQFTEAFGPTEQEYKSVMHYLEAHGLKVEAKYSNRALVSVSGAVPDIEKAFGVTLRIYHHPKENRTFYAADAVPSLDADVPVLGISGLDDYEPPRHRRRATAAHASTVKNNSATGSGPGGNFLGDDYRTAYVPGVSLDGAGQTVALYDGQYYATNPFVYARLAGRPAPNVANVYLDGAPEGDPSSPANDSIESDLDMDAIIAMAPCAAILVYEGGNEDCLNQMAIDNKAKQISTSISWLPPSPMQNQEMEQFAAQGQSFFMASGDEGSNGDDNGNPWAPFGPLVTDVGGTSLTTSGAGGPWQSETTWGGSAGGVAVNMPIPSYQQGISMAHNQGSTVYRNFPDVAIHADVDNTIVGGDGSVYTGWGGTSFASPLYAAFMALVNQQAAKLGNPPVGFLNPLIYAIGQRSSYTNDFHDITNGNNENSSFPTMFTAVSGYDLCTGWGSPRGQALIDALAGTNTMPNFSLSVPNVLTLWPNGLTVSQGSNVTTVVTITPGNGFDSSVNLSALNLPSGVTASFNPASATTASTLTFTAGNAAPTTPNPVFVTIVGTGGGLTRATTINLGVVAGAGESPDFSLMAAPGSLAVTLGGSSAGQIVVNTVNGFTGSVGLSASGLPSGVTAAFTPTNSTTGSTLTFIAAPGAAAGTNTVTVSGISGSLSHTTTIILIVLATNQIAAPAIADFGFETPSLGAGNYAYNPSGTGWTFGGASPDGSGIVANGSGFSNPNAPQGVQAAFLQEYGTISQAISGFIPGINYTISFAAAERGIGNNGGQTWNVMIDSTVVASYNPGAEATSYLNYTASFTASATVHNLSFVGSDLEGSNNTVFLDNVTIAVATNQLAAPVITLTAPANYAAFTSPATVNLAATVAANGNVINSVQFYANSTLIGQVTNAPYTYAWTDLGNGSYNVFAQVVYNGGSIADSTAASIAVTNSSINFGFETPSLGAGNYQYNPSGAAWMFTGSAAVTNGSGIVANNSALGNPGAPQGVQAAFIREQGVISQTLNGFTPGLNYTLTYAAAQRPGSAQSWNVMLDNAAIQINNGPGSTNYTTCAVNFTASAPVHTLSFVGTDLAGGDNTVFLDDIFISVNENFGFETPSLGSGNFQYDPSGASWTFSGASPNGSGIVANGSGFSNPNAPQGNQAAFVQTYGTMTQAISGFIPGTNYTLTFLAAERSGYSESWKVTVNGATIGSYNPGPGATAYVPYTANFTATAATETLAFVGTDLAGNEDAVFLDDVQIATGSSGTPAAPTGLTATAGNGQVSLSWTSVIGATSYNVESATVDGEPYSMLANVAGTNFVNTGLANGTTYYYVVSASNASGAGPNSSQVSATPQVPPPSLTAIAGNAQVSLSWTLSSGAVSYIVESATVNGGPYSTLGNVTGTNFVNTGLANGTTYYYIVWAMTPSGPTLNSSQVSATPPGPALTTVSNFGFETPSLGSGTTAYEYNPSGAAWTFSGASPNGSGILGNGSAFSSPDAPQGVQAAFVQTYGTIRQPVSGLIPGTNYFITFLAAERPGYSESWNVTVNGATVGSYNPGPSATSYVPYTATFTATAPTETLAFAGTDLAGNADAVFIDDVQIGLTGLTISPSPQVTTNTLPVTAADVAGSQVTFAAAFAAGVPMAFQWQKLGGGVTNKIPGATNTTLTLANLQLTNAGSYQLQASNVFGMAVSAPSSLTVSSVPAAVNNVITTYAAQTGLGSVNTNFVPTWTVAPGSLIFGQSPSSVGSGNFSLYGAGVVAVLTDGAFGSLNYWPGVGSSTTEVTCGTVAGGAGQSVTYTLAGSANGCNLTNIVVYGGWGDAGRDQQAYTVYYSTVAAPAAFIELSTVNYTPANASAVQCATRATLVPASGALATNVAAVKFNFTAPAGENGFEGYSEIELFGTANIAPATPETLNARFLTPDSFVINIGSLVAGRNYMLQSTTSLASGVWTTETNFIATQTAAALINASTNSVQQFYRVVGY
jgi:starvation-inducible outer membrane lipoprotein